MSPRWLWAVGALLCAQLLVPRTEPPPRSPRAAPRELKRPPSVRPATAARLVR